MDVVVLEIRALGGIVVDWRREFPLEVCKAAATVLRAELNKLHRPGTHTHTHTNSHSDNVFF
jgi:hypothetical protein